MNGRWRLAGLLTSVWMGVARFGNGQDSGGLDATFRFSPGGAPVASSSYTITSDGKVLVAGQFTTYHGTPRKGVVRLDTSGSVDESFDPKSGPGDSVIVLPVGPTLRNPGYADRVALTSEQKFVVGGFFSSWDGFDTQNLVRLESDGRVDRTFVSTLPTSGILVPLPDGKLLVAGRAGDFGTPRKMGLVRLDGNGSLDGRFVDSSLGAFAGTDFDAVTISQVVRQADGKLIVILVGTKSPSPIAFGVARLLPDGAIDREFKPGLTSGLLSSLSGISVDGSGRVLVAGSAPAYGGVAVGKVFRLTPTGEVDSTFTSPASVTTATGVHAFGDGSSIVTGTFNGVVGPVVRLQADGSRDATFGFKQSGSFGTLFVAMANQPSVSPSGQVFLLSSVVMIQSGGQILQGNGPIRLAGSTGGGTVKAPAIVAAPVAATVAMGGTTSFSVSATGTAPLTYQWSKNGSPIQGATGGEYRIAAVVEADQGEYAVTVSNLGGSVTSASVRLTVTRPPRIVSIPPSPLLLAQGVAASLGVEADGPGTLTYQWFRDGVPIAGAMGSVLSLSDPRPSDEGTYEVEVRSEYGSARSAGVRVRLAPSKPSWFVESDVDGPGQITDLWLDVPRGVVLGGTHAPAAAGSGEFSLGGVALPRPAVLGGFVARIDDSGELVWMLPVTGDSSHGLRVATYLAVAADRAGNVIVAGPMRGIGSVAGLSLGSAGTEGTFVAKLDSAGAGSWAQFVTGNLYERQLAVDLEGGVILTGRYTSDLVTRETKLPAMEFGAAAVFKFDSGGRLEWANRYQKADSVGGSVDIYNVTTDGDAIYLAGTYSQSIRFGSYTASLPGPPFRDVGWLGKLDRGGIPQWLKAIGGSLPKDIAHGGPGDLWVIGQDDPPGGQVLHGYKTDGTFVYKGVVARGAGSVLARGVAVDTARRVLFGGHASGVATIGSVSLGLGQNPRSLWGAAATPTGSIGSDARLVGSVTVPPPGELTVDEFEASPAGAFYYAGSWTGVFAVEGVTSTNRARKVFVAKTVGLPAPSAPVIVRQPGGFDYSPGENRALQCVATGGALTFRWLKNGQPIPESNTQTRLFPGIRPGEVGSEIALLGMTDANAGEYACEASNELGVTLSVSVPVRLQAGVRPAIGRPVRVGSRIRFEIPTRLGRNYRVESSTTLRTESWSRSSSIVGDGGGKVFEFEVAGEARFYRVAED